MLVGLFQNASVDGMDVLNSAISGSLVLSKSTAVMTPFTTVYIWLQSSVKGNSVCTLVTSPMTKLSYGGGIDTYSLIYDSTTGKFINAPAAKSAGQIDHVEPVLF